MDYSALFQIAGNVLQAGNGNAANKAAQEENNKAYAEMIANIKAQMAGYDSLGKAGYEFTKPEEVGSSELSNLQYDPAARQAQMEAMAQLKDMIESGGLTLADKAALNQVMAKTSQANQAQQNALANAFAARGQLGSGAQLAMSLAGNQNAANANNQAGESAAAQAQARAFQAIAQRGLQGRQMGNDQYSREAAAAQANDIIAKHNAAVRTANSQYNNKLKGQSFEDAMNIQRGKAGLLGDYNSTIYNHGQSLGNTTKANASITNNAIGQGASALGNAFNSGSNRSTSGSSDSTSVDNGDGAVDDVDQELPGPD